jgi:predicted acylesterase/phospholipase RssA
MKPKALVFRGGGVKNMCYAGVIRYLEENDMLSDVEVYAGTSGGSLTSAMLNLGYTSQEMLDDFMNTDIEGIFGTKNSIPKILYNSWMQYGIVDGTSFEKKLMEIIEKKTGKPKITFKELYTLTGKTLICTVACVNTHTAEYFSWHTVPDFPVYKALRMSMNLPPVFAPVIIRVVRTGIESMKDEDEEFAETWYNDNDNEIICKFSNKNSKLLPGVKEFEKWYVDGGLIDNYPVEYIEKNGYTQILGFVIETDEADIAMQYYPINRKWPWDYFKNLFNARYTELNRRVRECYISSQVCTTIHINLENISVYEFKITSAQLQRLFNDGYSSIKNHFEETMINPDNISDEDTDTPIFNINYIKSTPN